MTLIESIYNFSKVISKVVPTFSLIRSDKDKDAIALELANLYSRLSLFRNQTNDRLSDCEQGLDYLTRDELYMLSSYHDEALGGFNKCMKCIKDLNNDTLLSIIDEIILIVKDIKDKIDGVNRKKRIYCPLKVERE